MKIDPKATKADLRRIIDDLRDEATGWHQAAKRAEDKLEALVDQTGDRKPWLLFGAGCGVGAIVVSILWVVV